MGPIRILLLEDSSLDGELAASHLRRAGLDFTLDRVDSRAAFEAALDAGYDIILADYVVPGFDGVQALELARQRSPATPFVFVSGGLGEELAIDLLRRGAVDYVLKNRLERLAPSVRRAVNESRDRRERRRAEQALREMKDELEHRVAHRTTQLRQLTSELAQTEQRERRRLAQILHDHLQQLLVAAKIQLDISKASRSPEGAQQAFDRVRDLISESIEVSRSLTVELAPPVLYEAEFAAALRWLAEHMRKKHGLRVQVRADADIEPASEDLRVMLFEATRELLFNIVKHSGTDEASITLARFDGNHVRLVVSDAGKGFDRPSFDRDSDRGFGLFSIRERLSLLGCTLRIESSPGRGTTVYITAPGSHGTITAPPPAHDAAAPRNGRTRNDHSLTGCIRVVLADDHHVLRQGLAGLLEQQADIRVIGQATNGLDAVEMARELQPDVIVMDVTMPILDGIEAARRIASQWPHVRIVGLSMHDDDAVRSNMLAAGASAFLTKGGAVDGVTTAIRRAASPDGAAAKP